MLRTNTLELKPNKQQQWILKEMLVRSSAIRNVRNYHRRHSKTKWLFWSKFFWLYNI